MSGYLLDGNQEEDALVTRLYPLTGPTSRKFVVPGGTLNFPNIKNPLMDFLVSSLPGGAAGAYRNETPVVHECVLNWCVKNIQASFFEGGYQENITNERQLNTNNADAPWQGIAYYLPQFNLTLPDPSAPGGSTAYGTNNLTARVVQDSVIGYIPASWTAPNSTAPLWLAYDYRNTPILSAPGSANPWGTSTNITDLVDSMATTITNIMRSTRNDNTGVMGLVQGKAWNAETHVHLRWEWATLPVALLLFSLTFLITTVWRSSKEDSKVGIWKTSALAVLFNGLGEEIQETIGPRVRTGDARTRAKRLTVRLDD
jgi:hypothetical protein